MEKEWITIHQKKDLVNWLEMDEAVQEAESIKEILGILKESVKKDEYIKECWKKFYLKDEGRK